MTIAPAPWAVRRLVNVWLVSNSARRVRWNRSILPVVVGDRGNVRRCSIPYWRQVASNSTSTGGAKNRPVNTPASPRIAGSLEASESLRAHVRRWDARRGRLPASRLTTTEVSSHLTQAQYGPLWRFALFRSAHHGLTVSRRKLGFIDYNGAPPDAGRSEGSHPVACSLRVGAVNASLRGRFVTRCRRTTGARSSALQTSAHVDVDGYVVGSCIIDPQASTMSRPGPTLFHQAIVVAERARHPHRMLYAIDPVPRKHHSSWISSDRQTAKGR